MARKLPHPISKEDFDKIIDSIKKDLEEEWKPRKKEYTITGQKLKQYLIAICFGFGAGMRISEILGLEKTQSYERKNAKGELIKKTIITEIPPLSPHQIEENFVRVLGGKGKKDRIVPLPVKIFRKAGITRSELIRNLPLDKISYRTTQMFITKMGKKILHKNITFHQLRHGFATHALESGLDIHQVQMLMGHSRLDTTGQYLHANPKKILDKYGEVF